MVRLLDSPEIGDWVPNAIFAKLAVYGKAFNLEPEVTIRGTIVLWNKILRTFPLDLKPELEKALIEIIGRTGGVLRMVGSKE